MSRLRRKQNGFGLATIDISPLIDVVFILLIFFVITTTFTRQTGVEVNKPRARSSIDLKRDSLMIAITQEGAIHIHERQVDKLTLRNLLRKIISEKPNVSIIIMADKKSMAGTIIEVIDECNLAGAKNVSIASIKD